MTYRELIEKYIEGTLSEEEKAKLEWEIERQEAIGEYLFEKDEIPELGDLLNEDANAAGENTVDENTNMKESEPGKDEFVKMINKSIHRAFRRLAIVVLAISVAIGAFVQFCLPELVSGFYYDPTKLVGDGDGWNQMSLDMAVYTEMFLPANKRLFVNSTAKGYGTYDITVTQQVSYTGEFSNVSGEITRGKLKYYDENMLREPTGNCFSWFQADGWSEGKRLSEVLDEEAYTCASGNREQSIETLKNLDEREYYVAYVSLDRVMDYTSVKKLLDEQGFGSLWYAAKIETWVGGNHITNIGFEYPAHLGSSSMEWDNEKYPDLFTEVGDKGREYSEETAQQHFVSMLRYMADQKEFTEMIGKDQWKFDEMADYVEENGLEIYGFVCIVGKEELLKLSGHEDVYQIYTEELR